MSVRDSAQLFGIHAPDIPDDRWLEYLAALVELAEGFEPIEPDWD